MKFCTHIHQPININTFFFENFDLKGDLKKNVENFVNFRNFQDFENMR